MLTPHRRVVGWRGDAAAQTALNVFAAGLATVTLALAARSLPRVVFGHYAATVALSTLVVAASSLGLQATVVRGASADPARRRAMVEHGLVLRLAVAVPVSAVVAVIAAAVAPPPYRSMYLTVPALSTVSVVLSSMHLSYRSAGRARVSAAVDCVRAATLTAAVTGVCAAHALTGFRLVVVQAGVGAVFALAYAGPALRAAGARSSTLTWAAARALAAESVGMWAIEALNGLYLRADAVLLLLLAGSQAVAGYSVAYRAVDLVMLVPGAVGLAAMPSLSAAAPDRRAALVADLAGVMITLAALVLAGGLLLAPSVMAVLGGAHYTHGDVDTLRLLVVGATFSFPAGLAATAVLMFEGARRLLRPTVTVVAVNVIANWLLDPRLGARGAAVGLVLSEALTCVLAFVAFRRAAGFRVPLRPPAGLGPAVGAFCVAGLAVERFVPPSGSGLWRVSCGGAAGLATLLLLHVGSRRTGSVAASGDLVAGIGG